MLSKGRVLLVDDEPLVLEMLDAVLTEDGYDVFVAANSRQALEQIEKTVFNCLVCDVRLEDLNGFDILEIVKKKHESTKVVLITGAPNAQDEGVAKERGAVYLSKPISFDVLLKSVAS
jgi:two-component system, NtrC family, response regulator HydG